MLQHFIYLTIYMYTHYVINKWTALFMICIRQIMFLYYSFLCPQRLQKSHLLIRFANSFDPDHTPKNIVPNLDPNYLTLRHF